MMARIQNNPNTKDRKGQLCAPLLREGCKKYQIGTHYFASTLNCSSWVLTFGKIKILNIFFEPKSLQKQIISHHPWDWTSSYQWGTPGGILGTEDVASILVLGPEQMNKGCTGKVSWFWPPDHPQIQIFPHSTLWKHHRSRRRIGGIGGAAGGSPTGWARHWMGPHNELSHWMG